MTTSTSKAKGLAAALATVLLWASAFPMIRVGLADFDPVPLAALRFAIAAAPMLIWFAIRRPALPGWRDLALFAVCGLIGIAFYNVLLNTGQQTVSAGAASFIVNTVPVITVILAVLFLGERFGLRAWAGTLLSFGGVALIAMGQPGGLSFGAGATLVVAAAVCQGAFFTLQRSLIPRYGPTLCATLAIVAGALFFAPWAPVAVQQAAEASPSGLAAVVYLGLFPGGGLDMRALMASAQRSLKEGGPKPIAFNVVPQIDVFMEDGRTKEEWKMEVETRRILDLPDLPVAVTCVRVPVLVGHSEAVAVEFEGPVDAAAAREALADHPGIAVMDEREEGGYATPLETAGTDDVWVSRIRADRTVPCGLLLWIVADNVRKGAALNAVPIAERLIAGNGARPRARS